MSWRPYAVWLHVLREMVVHIFTHKTATYIEVWVSASSQDVASVFCNWIIKKGRKGDINSFWQFNAGEWFHGCTHGFTALTTE